jgi:UDP-arabinose 4-epimerase
MNILVTGGAGYIGSHTAKALAQHGHLPICIDDLSVGNTWAVKWGPLVRGSIGDAELVRRTVRDHQIKGVIHFAASAYVGESMAEPRFYFENNVINGLAFLNCILYEGIRSIVFSSSCATYGIPTSLPIVESQHQLPINPYGETKLFFERVLRWYGIAYGLKWIALRYFNAAGADPDLEIGEAHDPETHLIPLIIGSAFGLCPTIKVFGTDYPTPDGTAIRDYIHVSDLARAHVLALEQMEEVGLTGAFNLGSGKGYSVLQVIREVESVIGKPISYAIGPQRAGDPAELVAATGSASAALGWYPVHSELNTIVTTAVEWFQKQRRKERGTHFAESVIADQQNA